MKLLITFFLKYLLAPLLMVVLLFLMNSIKSIKQQLSIKNVIIYILLAGLFLGIPGFLAVLKDEYVWGGLFINVGMYFIYGLIFLRTMTGRIGELIGVQGSVFGQILVMLASAVLGAWIHYLIFQWQGGMPYGHWAMSNILWYTIPYLTYLSLQCFHRIPPPIYEVWNPTHSGYQRHYWDNLDHFKAKTVKVKIKRRTSDIGYASLFVRLPNDIPIGDWFDWFLQDQSKRTPQSPIEPAKDTRGSGWIFYTSRWISYPLFIRVLDPKQTGEENKIGKGQTIYAKRVKTENGIQNEDN